MKGRIWLRLQMAGFQTKEAAATIGARLLVIVTTAPSLQPHRRCEAVYLEAQTKLAARLIMGRTIGLGGVPSAPAKSNEHPSTDGHQPYNYIIMHKYIHVHMYIYIYTHVYGLGHTPPAFCDISKFYELRQFRANGLGYMSLGFRLRNFPISQIVLAHLGWDYLGNWEVCTCNHFPISQFPK